MNNRHYHLPLAILLLAAFTGVVVITGILAPIRPFVVLAFLLICPGLVFVRLLPIDNLIMVATLSIALSMAIDAGVATLFLYTSVWSWSKIFFIILGITMIGTLLDAVHFEIKQPWDHRVSSMTRSKDGDLFSSRTTKGR